MVDKMCEHSNGWRPEDGVSDLAMMSDITADGINVNLRTRYQRDQVYTFSGSVLLAVNPYKPLDIYTPEWVARFRGQKLEQSEPHVFALTEAMYMNLVMQVPGQARGRPGARNQACVISGESGAGKTETTKFILSYLCSVTPNKSIWMEHQILEANTILEAFGNAKTVRNDNSSRFGKFIQICFDPRHQINGCIIQDYLLEQSRITYQSVDERNYHVFYQLLAAGQTNQELRRKFHLMPANFYDFLNKTQCYTIDGVDDCAMFDLLRTAMSVLNMDQDCCDGLFAVLSAILWLGNLQFQCDEGSQSEQCHLTENDAGIINIVAELLGVDRLKLEPIMLRRQINVRATVTEIPFKINEARDNCNGMAKALYSRLFTWVVNFINASTNPGLEYNSFLGILDIFGFENFNTNSFEQLCINYANEKLHKFFNHHMFAMEQELYQREGIEFCDINYTDNTPCLELLERPPSCILRLLSEECRIPKGSDTTFIEKLHTEFSSANPNPFYVKGMDRRNWSREFSVKHFAGKVTYSVQGFLKKNKDAQQNQLLDIIESSTNALLRDLVTCSATSRATTEPSSGLSSRVNSFCQDSTDSRCSFEDSSSVKTKLRSQQSFSYAPSSLPNSSRVRRESSFTSETLNMKTGSSTKSKPTVADNFRHQLTSLVELLNSVDPWYVRCIKPNVEKSAIGYDDQQVLLQLKYLGMTDLIRIRREGYPIHLTKHQFVCRYRCLMLKHLRSNPGASPINLDETSLDNYCRRMMDYFDLDKRHWKIGKTMVLLRPNVYQPMENRRNQLFVQMATLIQSYWRCHVHRRQYLKLRAAASRIQETFRAYRGRLLYLRKKRATLTIQAYVRGMFAREIANALREIKRVEQQKEAEQALEERKLMQEQNLEDESCLTTSQQSGCTTKIVISESTGEPEPLEESVDSDRGTTVLDRDTESVSPLSQSNISPAVSSSASWVGQDFNNNKHKPSSNTKDKMEMDELVKVLERHGISLDALEQNGESAYADFEKLYDVLGNQLQLNCDANSSSSPFVDDDRCSYVTNGTTCDGDSVSCSGQSQLSSTVTDDQTCTDRKSEEQSQNTEQIVESEREDTVNPNQDVVINTLDDSKYHSNSIESIASIMSSTSVQSAQQNPEGNQVQSANQNHDPADSLISPQHAENLMKQIVENQARTSTFTGNSMTVTGSKMVSNGRPLTRIEEEPNSTTTSPSKTPHKKRQESGPNSLFPPQDEEFIESDKFKQDQSVNFKKRRLERKIQQVQQDQVLHQVNPTTAGLPISNQPIVRSHSETATFKVSPGAPVANRIAESDSIYDLQKNSIIEYVEQVFNNHPRDSSNGSGVIRTLTRRRRSVDAAASEYLSKGEMLAYNSSFMIPTSHIKMHDPHNIQISCSMFKNLCKYMTGDSIKFDTETRIIQSIIRHGIEKTELRDEIYVQIIRQLTNNPNSEYAVRLWVLLGLVSASFSPSKAFSKHLIAYIRTKPKKDPSITCHAQFCLDNLQAPRLNARKHPPSPLEIQACKSLLNLTCKVHLLDGRSLTLSIHPCDTALDAMTKLAHKIDLQSIEGWALYESYTPGASKYPHPDFEHRGDFERSIRAQTYIADLIASWQDGTPKKVGSDTTLKLAQKRLDDGNFKLTFKKKIFRGPKIRNDPVEISLLYAQAVHNVVKKDCYFVDENLALSLAGIQAQVKLGNASDLGKPEISGKKDKSAKLAKVSAKNVAQFYEIEEYICHRIRNQASKSKKDWCNLISHSHKQFHNANEVFCKMRYLSMVICHCPLYGTATFNVIYKGYQTMEQNLMLGINAEGIVLIRSSDKALINAHRYSDICKDSGITVFSDEHIIQFNVQNRNDRSIKCLSFESTENEEISMLMVCYSPQLNVYIRGSTTNSNFTLDPCFEQGAVKKKIKLKMTLEDRMRTHQEVQNARKAIIKSGKLRKPDLDEFQPSLFRHTLKRLSSKSKVDKPGRFENVYGTILKSRKQSCEIPQASSDYNLYGSISNQPISERESKGALNEVAGATASTTVDESTKLYPHRYWAYTRFPLKSTLLIIYDPDLEEAALNNFNAVLKYSGLISYQVESSSSGNSTLETSSIDSGIASQQSLSNSSGKNSGGSPSSVSSGDIYEVCPKKMDERELLRLAQGILDRCLKKNADILKNEFFLQLIKQTTDHPDPNSEINQRHWQLLALACSVTYPSDSKILSYLYAHLRRCSLDQVTDEGQYAQFTLRSLQGTLDTKGRRLAPSEAEILSTINCRRVYARVYFLDGQFQAVEFDPCATIAEVVDQIKQKIGLRPDCGGYALFQPLGDDCEQVLRPEEKVGDAIAAWELWHKQKQAQMDRTLSQQNNSQVPNTNAINKASLATLNSAPKNKTHRFTFKKYLFLEPLVDSDDPVERELLYYQTVSSIKEDKFPILEQEATILCALKAQIEIGDYTKLSNLPREHIRMVYKQVIMSLMPPHSFNNLPIPDIAQQHQAFRDLSCAETKRYFFNLIQSFGRANFSSNPGYILLHKAHIYEATQTFASAWSSDIWIVINQTGLHMLVQKSRTVLASCEYRQIVDCSSSNNYLIVIMPANAQSKLTKYTFYTKQAQQIAQQMKDYILISAYNNPSKGRKSVEFNLKQPTPNQNNTRHVPIASTMRC